MTDSIWTNSARLPEFPTLRGKATTEVLVIGGGMAGILCAYMLREAGVDCLLVEENRLAGGITGNTTAKITAQHGLCYHGLRKRFGQERAKLYLQANLSAVETYRNLCGKIDCDFTNEDSFVYSPDAQALEKEMEALHALGSDAKLVSQVPLPIESAGAVRFAHQAQFHPLRFLAGITPGLKLYERTAVRELRGCTAITDGGRITADKIIVATHFPFLNKHGAYFLKLYQQRSYVLALENAEIPQGMYIGSQKNSLSFRGHGQYLLLGGGGHRTGKPGGGWQALRTFAQVHYPGAKAAFQWATQDCMTLDGMPYIGRYSRGTENLYVTTGFNKWGMTGAMTGATLLRDLILGKSNPCQELFSPSRSMLRPQLFVNGAEAAGGLLYPGGKRCPHMGCRLKWNAQEHSWDCSCHGSRFSGEGKRLDNPATGDRKEP